MGVILSNQAKSKVIVIDPGHGGVDSNGKYHTSGKMFKFPNGDIAYEGQINRDIAKSLGDILINKGYKVVYTVKPDDYRDPSLSSRVSFANSYKADEALYISIHNNAAPKPGTASGFEIFTSPGKTASDDLADSIYKNVESFYKTLGLKMRSDLSDGDYDKEQSFYVLTKTKMPAVLLECLFFDNYSDFQFLRQPAFTAALAMRIADGIINYLQS